MSGYRSHDIQEIHSEFFSDNSIFVKFHFSVLFGVVCATYLLLTYIAEAWIFTDDFYYRNLSTEIPLYSIEGSLESKERFWWVAYPVQIVVILFNMLFVSVCIFIGVLLTDVEWAFKNIFKSVITAEVIFIIAQCIYLINLYINLDMLTLETTANYFPLSMLSFFGTENIAPWLHYPLQTLNLFEVAYILCISWLLSRQWKPDFIESINIVLPSYGIGLLIWMVLVVFLTLQIS